MITSTDVYTYTTYPWEVRPWEHRTMTMLANIPHRYFFILSMSISSCHGCDGRG